MKTMAGAERKGELDVNFATVERGGFLWPASDQWCSKVIFDEVGDIDAALAFTDRRAVAVQAGGNVGVWAAHLARHFETVHTFEPDPVNFACLTKNVPINVRYQQAGLGDRAGHVRLEADPRNVGAHWVNGKGPLPMITIDSLNLPACDFICLDVEGFEPLALRGAEATIRRCRPVIMIEEKGLSERYYKIKRGTAERWLAETFGYRVAKKVRKDLILTCEPA